MFRKIFIYLLIYFAGFYFLFFVGISPSFSDSKPSNPIVKNEIKKYYVGLEHFWLIDPIREKTLEPLKVAKSINIRPGMTVVDIGAGYGMFTFVFADMLKGTGEVFATDIETERVEYLKNKVEEGGFKNVFPVLVGFKGLDDFYKQHTFDIIFLGEMFEALNPEEYFKEIRPYLKKDTGRIYILNWKTDPDLDKWCVGNFGNIIKIMRAEEKDFPVFNKLNRKSQDFVKKWKEIDAVPEEIENAIIKDFNAMLLDRFLYPELRDYYSKLYFTKNYSGGSVKFNKEDEQLGKWLVFLLESNKVFDKQKKDISEVDKRNLHRLNKAILAGTLKMPRFAETFSPWRETHKDYIVSTMEEAGYIFVAEHDILTNYYIFEFRREK